jgi:CarboxypepD_reg-like domain/TonB dependent receptor/TonB-dependent Receptor Plug Domain
MKINKKTLISYCILAFLIAKINSTTMAQTVRIFGKIIDSESGETLIGAGIFNKKFKTATVSNEYGFYSLAAPRGILDLEISYVGYQKKNMSFTISKDTNIDIRLSSSIELKELEIVEKRNDRIEHGVVTLPIEKLKSIPMIGGEADVLKALSFTPGVATGSEGQNALYVRGGTPDQNLILLDGATVYNASHLFGFLSTFNPYALKNLSLIKGGFPARYGGRLSSIIDVTMKEGNNQKKEGEFSLGIINSSLNLEGPIKKGISSYMLSGRTAYLGLLAYPTRWLYNQGRLNNYTNFFMYDLNGKINFRLSDKTHLYFSAYTGNDAWTTGSRVSKATFLTDYKWGNQTATARLTHTFRSNLFATVMLNYNRFNYQVINKGKADINLGDFNLTNTSRVRDLSNKINIDWSANSVNQLRLGWEINAHQFSPNFTTKQVKDSIDTSYLSKNKTQSPNSFAAYLEDNIKVSNIINLNVGFRYAQYIYNKKSYYSPEPRLSLQIQPNTEGVTLQASYTRMKQFIHLLSTSGSGISNDIWVPATEKALPSTADQVSLSFSKNWKKEKIDLQVESFYKKMDNQIEYRSGTNFFFTNNGTWEDVIERNGIGRAYGAEIFLRKEAEKWSGWLSYTLSWSERKFDNINNKTWYPMHYDRRHNLALVGEWKINDEWTMAANFVFMTGYAVTLPNTSYTSAIGLNSGYFLGTKDVYTKRNNARMPLYNRMDISFKKTYLNKNDRETSWVFSAYNLYAYPNTYSLDYIGGAAFYQTDIKGNQILYSKPPAIFKKTLFRLVPGVSYSLKLQKSKK